MCEVGADNIPNAPTWAFEGVLERTRECPKSLITEATYGWFRLYRFYKHNTLPVGVKSGYGAGLYEQPNNYLQAMEVIEGHLHQPL